MAGHKTPACVAVDVGADAPSLAGTALLLGRCARGAGNTAGVDLCRCQAYNPDGHPLYEDAENNVPVVPSQSCACVLHTYTPPCDSCAIAGLSPVLK